MSANAFELSVAASSVLLFGEYLVDEGEVDSAHIAGALELCSRRRRRIGEMAVAAGLISPGDAQRLNKLQRTRNRSWGRLAVEASLLSELDVERLARQQSRNTTSLSDALVELGYVSRSRVEELLDRFHRREQGINGSLPAWFTGHPMCPGTVEACRDAFVRVLATEARIGGGELTPPPEASLQIVVTVEGEATVRIGLAMELEVGRAVAAALLGCEPAEVDVGDVADAVGEFVNIFVGLAKSEADGGDAMTLCPPRADAFPREAVFEVASPLGHVWLGFGLAS